MACCHLTAQTPFYTCTNCRISDAWRTDSATLLAEQNFRRLILLDHQNAPVDTLEGLPLQWLYVTTEGRWFGMGSWFGARGWLRAGRIELEEVVMVPTHFLFDGIGVNFLLWKNWLICSGRPGKSEKSYKLWDLRRVSQVPGTESSEAMVFPPSVRSKTRVLAPEEATQAAYLIRFPVSKKTAGELYQFGASRQELFVFDWLTATLFRISGDGKVEASWRLPSAGGRRKWQYAFDSSTGTHWIYYPFKKEILVFEANLDAREIVQAARLPAGHLLRIVNGRAVYLDCQGKECRLEEWTLRPDTKPEQAEIIQLEEIVVKPW